MTKIAPALVDSTTLPVSDVTAVLPPPDVISILPKDV